MGTCPSNHERPERIPRVPQCQHPLHGAMHHCRVHRWPGVLLPSPLRRHLQHLRGVHLAPPLRRHHDRERHRRLRHAQLHRPPCQEGDCASLPVPVRPPHYRPPPPPGVGIPHPIQQDQPPVLLRPRRRLRVPPHG